MKKCAYGALMAAVILIAAGCATTTFRQEPRNDMGTLMIGQVQIEVKDWPDAWLNGVHQSDILVYLVELGEMKEIRINSHKDGAFYLVLPNKKTKILLQGFEIKEPLGRIWVPYNRGMILSAGKVNNVGRFMCTVQIEEAVKKRTKYTEYNATKEVNVHYLDVWRWFQRSFPESAWNDREWESLKHYDPTEG